MKTIKELTPTRELNTCNCGAAENWKESGGTWMCTCPDLDVAAAYPDYKLIAKILEIYPEISQHKISLGLSFSAEKSAYVLNFRKGAHELTTYLEKKDADECMAGKKCVYLGVQVGQFIRNFEGEVTH